MAERLNILVVSGVASGDTHAGALLRQLRQRLPRATFFDVGGPRMREAGLGLRHPRDLGHGLRGRFVQASFAVR